MGDEMPNARLAKTSDLAALLELYRLSEVSPNAEPKQRAEQIWASDPRPRRAPIAAI